MSKQIIIDGQLFNVFGATYCRAGWIGLSVGPKGTPAAEHAVPEMWWRYGQGQRVRTSGHVYAHPSALG